MANATGRPVAPLILTSDERAYLQRQVRRHRVARSLSERCRVILRCADGMPSKSVASELGVHESCTSLDLIQRSMSDYVIHSTAGMIGDADRDPVQEAS
jgi:FixJ family two-component response regulator